MRGVSAPSLSRVREALESGFGGLVSFLNAIGTILIIAMIALMVGDVLGRLLFNSPIDGTNEMVELSIVAILFLQVGYALRQNSIARSDLLERILLRRCSWIVPYLNLIFAAMGCFAFGVLFWAVWPVLVRDFATNTMVGVPGVFSFPKWPTRLVVLIGAGVVVLQFLFSLLENARAVRRGKS
jgi:TRAP-type mannitol/chloroaromatic compound transport system permease small subunit|uniref:TRAP transporter small permease protein n=1 Tax=Chelativorans sp. (strain BNC1) TaxID=266779 RepID=Q11E99_CHESB